VRENGRNVRSAGSADCLSARLSAWALKAREYGIIDHVSIALRRALFSTLTNVNFDSPRIVGYAREAITCVKR
jgi:hydroxylamine reductase (hybrid-cluster protein)